MRKDIIHLKNQRESLIIDYNKPIGMKPNSPSRVGTANNSTPSLYLGKNPIPREEFNEEKQHNFTRKGQIVEDSRLTEVKPRKRMAEGDGRVKELMSTDAKHPYIVDTG